MYDYDDDKVVRAPIWRNVDYGGQMLESDNSLEFAGASRKIVGILVYVDEEKKKFLDVRTLMFLLGYEPSNKYTYLDGKEIIASDSILINKPDEIPSGWVKREDVFPDFSNIYPYDKELGLYEVTDEQLDELIRNYETYHPDVKISVTYEDIVRKKGKHNKNINDYSFAYNSDNYKDDYNFEDINVHNKDYDSSSKIDSVIYNNYSKYTDNVNKKDIDHEEIDSMIKENDYKKYGESDSNSSNFYY